jgi:hypothetical protein
MRKRIAHLACLAALAPAAAAATSSASPDYSDLWWNEQESGWGAQVVLQGDVVFMVLFVYDANRQPRFLVSPELDRTPSGDAFEGALYTTTGPGYAAAFDPSAVTTRLVGTAHLTLLSPGSARLDYTVDGVAVSKAITRQAWRTPDLSGDYMGGVFGTATPGSCILGLPTFNYPGSVHVAQSGDSITIDTVFAPGFAEQGTCRYLGRVTQSGSQLAITQGTYSCSYSENPVPTQGSFTVTAIESAQTGFGGRFEAVEDGACVHSGKIGGIRRGYPDPQPGATDPE